MQNDIRAEAAQYYDTNPAIPDDIAFYQARLSWSDASVLELGCGTGRVLLPRAASCGFIHGIDRSHAMLARCRQKLQAAAIPPSKARVEHMVACNRWCPWRGSLLPLTLYGWRRRSPTPPALKRRRCRL